MTEGEKLLYMAQELQMMVDAYHSRMDGLINREHIISQALHGVQLSMTNVVGQTELVIKIEKEYPE